MALLIAVLAVPRPAAAQAPGPWVDDGADTGGLATEVRQPRPCPHWVLRDGVELPELPELYHRMRPARAWGTPELVDLLIDTAAQVAFEKPDADRIVIGDLSTKRGGTLSGHRSHKGGIDADLGLFFYDGRQHKYGFLEPVTAAFDLETNWIVIRTMLESGLVERIFLDQRYLRPLRRHAVQVGDLTPEEARQLIIVDPKERWRTGTVRHAAGHRDHLHVRIRCTR